MAVDERPEQVTVLADPAAVADQVARRFLDTVVAQQADGHEPFVVLTGGSISRRVHALVADLSTAAGSGYAVDWSRVHVWWGDDRYVSGDDEDRNSGQAWADLLGRVPVNPALVHPMPASDAGFDSPEAAAQSYAAELEKAVATRPDPETWFDVLMLGIGPDGHCASLFPGRPEVHQDAVALAVHDSPKPPPTRISLGMPVLGRSAEVWFVATGAEKAEAVAASVAGQDIDAAPSAGPRGLTGTTWFVDEAAASIS